MESEKPMTMISGVITFRNMLRRKSSQPSVPSAHSMATRRRRRGDEHERQAAEEEHGDDAAGDEADDIVDDAVALDGVADLELHDRNAGEAAGDVVPSRSKSTVWRISPTTSARPRLSTTSGFERQDDQRQRAILGEKLAADDVVVEGAIDERLVLGVDRPENPPGRAVRECRRRRAAGARRTAR